MKYVLDTDACIWVLRGRGPVVSRVRAQAAGDVGVTAMTEAELRYGALRSSNPAGDLARVEALLSDPVECLPFDRDAAVWHADLRAALRSHPIGERDLVIASIAMANRCAIVTGNAREFGRVPGLVVEDWLRE